MTRISNTTSGIYLRRQARKTNQELRDNSAKISSGSRITKSSDDAAGLSMSTKMNANIRSQIQASRNAQDFVSVLQIMEGRLSGQAEMMVRIRELTIQAATGSISDNERELLNLEVEGLIHEIKRTAESTNHLNQDLLKGDQKKFEVQVDKGNGKNDRLHIDLSDFAQTPFALGIDTVKIDKQYRAQHSLAKIDYAIESLSMSRAEVGAIQNRIQSTIGKLGNDVANHTSSKSRITDLDYAQATAKQASAKIKQSVQTSIAGQVNNMGASYLKLLK